MTRNGKRSYIILYAVYSGVHGSAERPLSRWAARDAYNPRRHMRISTAKPAAKP